MKPTKSMIEGAVRYAQFDKSDPFAFSRAMTHNLNGIASPRANAQTTNHGHYDAERRVVERTLTNGAVFSDGAVTYHAEEYINAVRP